MRLIIVHPGIVYNDNVSSVRVRAFVPLSASSGLHVRHPLLFRSTPKLHLLVFSVFFAFFLLPAAYTTATKRETKTKFPLMQEQVAGAVYEVGLDLLPDEPTVVEYENNIRYLCTRHRAKTVCAYIVCKYANRSGIGE